MRQNLEIDGIAGSELKDSQGELLSVEGADISELEAGRGRLNDNHQKGFFNTIGRITTAKKIFKVEDCEDDRQRYYWDKVKAPYIYFKGMLFDDETHANAQAAGAILRNIHREDCPLKLKASVEGGVLARGMKDPSILARTKIHSVALTFTPANNATLIEPVSIAKCANFEADLILIRAVEHLAKTDVPSFRHITRHASALKIINNIYNIIDLAKTMGIPISQEEMVALNSLDPEELIKAAAEIKIKKNMQQIRSVIGQLTKDSHIPYGLNLDAAHESHVKSSQSAGKRPLTREEFDNYHKLRTGKIDESNYKYKGPEGLWVSVQEHAMEGSDAPIKGQICVTPFGEKEDMYADDSEYGITGNVYKGKPSHLFPFDTYSGYDPETGKRSVGTESSVGVNRLPLDPNTNQKEGWLVPRDNKHVGNIHISRSPNLDHFLEHGRPSEHDKVKESHKQGLRHWVRFSSGKQAEIKPEHFERFEKALTAGYGGASAPTSRTGGAVLQSEAVSGGRGFQYVTCRQCGKEQVFMPHQVKCRSCGKSLPFDQLKPLLKV